MKRLKLFFMAMVMLFAVQICTVSVTCETQAATTTATDKEENRSLQRKRKILLLHQGQKDQKPMEDRKGKTVLFRA